MTPAGPLPPLADPDAPRPHPAPPGPPPPLPTPPGPVPRQESAAAGRQGPAPVTWPVVQPATDVRATPPPERAYTSGAGFDATAAVYAGPPGAGQHEEPDPRERRRRLAIIATSGMAVAAAGVAAVTAGLFSYDKPTHDKALPEVDTSVPDTGIPATEEPDTAPVGNPVSRPPRPATGSTSPSASPSAGSPTSTQPLKPGGTATPSKAPDKKGSASPSAPRDTARPTTSAPAPPPVTDGTLRVGDRGAAVQELQRRLWELRLYTGSQNGVFNSEVSQALIRYQIARGIPQEMGSYGPATRRSLEGETSGSGSGGDGRSGWGGSDGGGGGGGREDDEDDD